MASLLDIYDLSCPRCGNAEVLHISIACTAVLTIDGSEPLGDHEWDHASVCVCPDCNHSASCSVHAASEISSKR